MGKGFATFMARIWFLPSVNSNVTLQDARVGESFVAFIAGMRFHPSMDLNVFLEVNRF